MKRSVTPLIMSLSALAFTNASLPAQQDALPKIHSQPSFIVSNQEVEVALTQHGAHMAPVSFYRNAPAPVLPYHISPWQDEAPTPMPAPVLNTLRGDFFCLPFGGNAEPVAGEKHPPHGEIVGDIWRLLEKKKTGPVSSLKIAIETNVRKGTITRELSLIDGHNVVYSKSTIEGFAGRAPVGHHATLAMPEKEGSVRIATSPIHFGMTAPGLFSDPKNREYQSLLPGAKWTNLTKVPTAWKDAPEADLSRLPARYGYADLVQIVNQPQTKDELPAWTTATFTDSGYLWFALKDPTVLNSTVFWIENHGRHGHPWNGRNHCLGLEDVTAFFAEGLAASTQKNALTQQGVQTALTFRADQPTSVHYIQGVVKIPADFEQVKTLEFGADEITFHSVKGKKVTAPVRHSFLRDGKL